jgi:hypothetical protein
MCQRQRHPLRLVGQAAVGEWRTVELSSERGLINANVPSRGRACKHGHASFPDISPHHAILAAIAASREE